MQNIIQQVALYARVSSQQQSEQQTIQSQLSELEKRVNQDGLQLQDELRFIDDGYSGSSLIRPALERMRDMAHAGAINRLYVLCPDRLARRYALQALLLDELDRAAVEVVFCNRAIGDTPEDELLLQMQGMIAEYERAKILERSRRGKRHAASEGKVSVLGGAPYGYHYVNKHEGAGQARYEIIFEEAQVVQKIYRWVGLDRLSIGEVCRRLKAEGVLTRKGKSSWDRSTVWGLLKNPAYSGRAAFGKTKVGPMRSRIRAVKGSSEHPRKAISTYAVEPSDWSYIEVPALVDRSLFDAVQSQLEENRKRSRQHATGARYLLQGLLICDCCGHAYYGKSISRSAAKGQRRDYAYYRCIGTDAYRFGGERICPNKQVRTDFLEEAVWADVCSLLREPKRLESEYSKRLHSSATQAEQTLQQSRKQTDKVKQGISRLIDGYEEGWIEKDEFEPRMKRLKKQLEGLKEAQEELATEAQQKQALQLIITRLEEFGSKLSSRLDEADWQTRRELIRLLVKHVKIGQENVEIVYRINFEPDCVVVSESDSLQHCLRRDCPAPGSCYDKSTPLAIARKVGSCSK